MTTTRRTVLALAATVLISLCALPQTAAAGTPARPELGPLSPAFVEALHDPLVELGLGRMPSPVEVKVGAAAEATAEPPRARRCPPATTCAPKDA